jgi:hypothetical protein
MKASGQVYVLVASMPKAKTPGKHRIRGWVRSTAGADAAEKRKILALAGTEPRSSTS